MRIIARRTLKDFWRRHHDAEEPLKAWFAEASHATWASMNDIKKRYAHASVINSETVVFNIAGNKYRLVAKIWFAGHVVWIKFIGTHGAYDEIDVSSL